MARKRKAPPSQQPPPEQKPKILPKVVVESEESEPEEEEENPESESESEESESESESEPEDEESKRQTIREILEPFGKPQIIELLKQAASKDPDLLSKLISTADSDPTNRKIFIHGLGWDATSEHLVQTFSPFGEIEDTKLITDKNTGRAKGYAFVLFKTRSAAKKALKVPEKRIGSRTVSCQLAALGHAGTGPGEGGGVGVGGGGNGGVGSRKVYVGNVGPNVDPERLKAFFRTFGEIEDLPIGVDMATGKFKGFAVITFKEVDGFNKAVQEPIKLFEGCQLHCKKFTENPKKEKVGTTGQSSGSQKGGGGGDVSFGNLIGGGLNPGGIMMQPNPMMGLAGNPMLAAGYNPAGFGYPGLSAPIGGMSSISPSGVMGNYGMNSISPSGVMGNYGSQAALQGLGPFQNVQTGQSSALGTVATATTATRAPASGMLSTTANYPSRFTR